MLAFYAFLCFLRYTTEYHPAVLLVLCVKHNSLIKTQNLLVNKYTDRVSPNRLMCIILNTNMYVASCHVHLWVVM